jgi:hypothetical protein
MIRLWRIIDWCSVYFNRTETKAIAGGACALAGGAVAAFAQGANANGNCIGIISHGVPRVLAAWNPFVLDKNAGQCK